MANRKLFSWNGVGSLLIVTAFLVVFLATLGMLIALSALAGLCFETVWNFVVLKLHHSELQIDFLTSCGILWIIGVLGRMVGQRFQITINKKGD